MLQENGCLKESTIANRSNWNNRKPYEENSSAYDSNIDQEIQST